MSEIHKVPASAGAEWLLSGFALLRKAPLALGTLGVIWGLLAMLVMAVGMLSPVLALPLQFLLLLAGPIVFGGMVWAVREVDQGRAAHPSHLLQGLHEGRAPHLLTSLLPQLAAGLVLGVLLLLLLGGEGLRQLGEVTTRINEMSQSGAQPDPAAIESLIATLPAGRILLWLLLVIVGFAAMTLALFTLPPQVMFDQRSGFAAMRDSLRACLHNLLPMLVFFVLGLVAVFAIYFGVMMIALIAQLIGGPMLGLWVAQLLLMAVAMPVFAGAVYAAWKQMFGVSTQQAPLAAKPGHIFEA